ncbi:hypothetical protein [Bacillus sp. SA1-12]|uniref:hypothetical protein n=1 Tax=Bacillus sp. SA1-12 TaxID=1455638 RepID=UPI0012E02CB8|nr:hypothetical protein [Bacillus sp. SA1-12]
MEDIGEKSDISAEPWGYRRKIRYINGTKADIGEKPNLSAVTIGDISETTNEIGKAILIPIQMHTKR